MSASACIAAIAAGVRACRSVTLLVWRVAAVATGIGIAAVWIGVVAPVPPLPPPGFFTMVTLPPFCNLSKPVIATTSPGFTSCTAAVFPSVVPTVTVRKVAVLSELMT